MGNPRPVQEIEGIGTATARSLELLGIAEVSDLLHFPVALLHDVVSDLASENQVRRWVTMAALMDVEQVDGQIAEALADAGIDTTEQLARTDIDTLAGYVDTAINSGTMPAPDVPTNWLDVITAATRIVYGGTSMGIVREPGGAPVHGASINVGGQTATSGLTGRFRITGIAPADSHTLRIEASDWPLYFESPHTVRYDDRSFDVREYSLGIEGVGEAFVLDEYDGVRLPALSSYETEWRRIEATDLRDGDVFVVNSLYRSAPDAKIVSIFRRYESGTLVATYARVPLAAFASDQVSQGDAFRYRDGAFQPVAGGLSGYEWHRANRRIARELQEQNGAPPESFSEYFAWYSDALSRHYAFTSSQERAE